MGGEFNNEFSVDGEGESGGDSIKNLTPRRGDFSLQEKIAMGCRHLADHGHADTLAGQITALADEQDSVWTTAFGTGLGEARVNNLVRCDSDLKVVEGQGLVNPAVRFHWWIYRSRPDVKCIVHTHPAHCAALSMTTAPLVIAHMDTTMFYENCGRLHDWPGLPFADEEGRLIADALGEHGAVILNNHGLLTVGATVEEAIYLAFSLEHAAKLQVLAALLDAPIKSIDPEHARKAGEFMKGSKMISLTVESWFRAIAREYPEVVGRPRSSTT